MAENEDNPVVISESSVKLKLPFRRRPDDSADVVDDKPSLITDSNVEADTTGPKQEESTRSSAIPETSSEPKPEVTVHSKMESDEPSSDPTSIPNSIETGTSIPNSVEDAQETPADSQMSTATLPDLYCASSLEDNSRDAFPGLVANSQGDAKAEPSISDAAKRNSESPSRIPQAIPQKLTLKIQRNVSVAALKDEKTGSDAIEKSEETSEAIQSRDEDMDEDQPRLTIVTDEQGAAQSNPNADTPAKSSPKKRGRKPHGTKPAQKEKPAELESEEEDMLNSGTEINGCIYYTARKRPNSGNTTDGKVPVVAPTSAAVSTGRQRRQAAINNKLIQSGIADDEGSDEEYNSPTPSPPERSPRKKPRVPTDSPQTTLAKVRANLGKAAGRSPSTASAKSAQQRLSKKLGLSKRQ